MEWTEILVRKRAGHADRLLDENARGIFAWKRKSVAGIVLLHSGSIRVHP